MTQVEAVRAIARAGQYIVKDRGLHQACRENVTALQAALSGNPDLQVLAILSVAEARVLRARTDGWDKKICDALGLQL